MSEVYTSSTPFFDSIYVTTPAGITTGHKIPYISNVAAYDSALSLILYGITILGCRISDWEQGRSYFIEAKARSCFRWILKQP